MSIIRTHLIPSGQSKHRRTHEKRTDASPHAPGSRQVRNIDQLHAIVEACHTVRIGALDEEGMFIVPP